MNNEKILKEMLELLPKIEGGFSRPFTEASKDTVSGLQLRILMILRNHSSICMGKTAQELHVSKQQLSVAMDKLVNFGFVIRKTDQVDRRKVTLCLTKEAESFLDALYLSIYELHNERFDCLTEDEKIRFYEACHDLAILMDKIQRQDVVILHPTTRRD